MYHRVLVPLDSTPLSEKVLSSAFRAADAGGEIIVLRIQSEAANLEDNAQARQDLDAIERETDAVLARVRASLASDKPLTVKAEVRTGPLAGTIIDASTETEADLIVMGTHGRKGLADQLLGSATEKVVTKASASVFVVKAEGYPFLQD